MIRPSSPYYVGMIECGDSTGLPLEAGESVGVAGHFWRQNLEGHVSRELCVHGAVHLAHAARAN